MYVVPSTVQDNATGTNQAPLVTRASTGELLSNTGRYSINIAQLRNATFAITQLDKAILGAQASAQNTVPT